MTRSIYVQIQEDAVVARNLADGRSIKRNASPPFSHPRMLIGDFSAAQACFKAIVAEARGGGMALRTKVLMHPLEKIEGGLTQIEERVLQELAVGAGASIVKIWVGKQLSDDEALSKLSGQ